MYEEDNNNFYFSPMFLVIPLILLLFGFAVHLILSLVPHIKNTAQVNAAMMVSSANQTSNGTTESQSSSASTIAPFFSDNVHQWESEIVSWALTYDIDPNLIATVMQIESCGNPHAVSSANAQGLFQVMPYHFSPGEYMHNPDINAKRGMNYLKEALEYHHGDVRLALAAYNGGLTTSTWAEHYWPQETQRYVYWGTQIYEDATNNALESMRYNEWFSVGYPLCQQTELVFNP